MRRGGLLRGRAAVEAEGRDEHVGALRSARPLGFAPAVEAYEGRDPADAEPAGELREVVAVHLRHDDATRVLRRDLLQLGGDHVTGATPRRPEVDHDRDRRLTEELV